MQLRLRTLTPLHIGSGDEVPQLEYFVHRGTYYKVPQDVMVRFLQEHVPNGPRLFADWISERFQQIRELRNNKELKRIEQRMSPWHFCDENGKARDLIQFLHNTQALHLPVILDEKVRKLADKHPVVSLGKIQEALKTGRQRPYLPGSTLKGALRTAVFYHWLTNYVSWSDVQHLVDKQVGKKAKRTTFAAPLETRAFYCGTRNLARKKTKDDDEKMDLFKLIQFSDAHLTDTGGALNMAKINLYLVAKEKKDNRSYRHEVVWKTQSQGQTSYAEMIVPDRELTTELDFNIDFLLRLKDMLKDGAVVSGKEEHWIGVEKRVQQLFGITIQDLTEANKEEKRQQAIDHLLQIWASFSQRQVQSDVAWRERIREHDPRDEYASAIDAGYQLIEQLSGKRLMNLGYATGFQGTTALLYFLDDTGRHDTFEKVMSTFNLGKAPRAKGKYTPRIRKFPKSKRLVEWNEQIVPLGWLVVSDDLPKDFDIASTMAASTPPTPAEPEPPKEIVPEFPAKKVNYKKPPLLDAVVIKSGRPNRVKVYLSPEEQPELELNRYRNPLDVDTIIKVEIDMNKKGKVLQASFRGFKK